MGSITPRTVPLASGQAVIIRAAELGDALQLSQHINAIIEEDVFNVVAPGERTHTVEEESARIAEFLAHPTHLLLVAIVAGQLVGTIDCTGGNRRRIAHSVNFGISVAPEFRNQRIGRLLIATLLEWARAHPQIEKVTLGVLSSNARAYHVYASLGFIEEGRHFRFVKYEDGSYVDDIQMYLWVQ